MKKPLAYCGNICYNGREKWKLWGAVRHKPPIDDCKAVNSVLGRKKQTQARAGSRSSLVVDCHSHILPKMDDGSKSVEMSLEMLRTSGQAGVDLMWATPHFYGYREHIDSFLARRQRAWDRLAPALTDDCPGIRLGAEVTLYSGLMDLEGLDRLCLDGSRILLLEMPFTQWGGMEFEAVASLCLDQEYQVVLAHFERFIGLQKDTRAMSRMLTLPLWVQVNAGSLCSFTTRRQAVSLFREGKAHFLGSDTHNMDRRPPNLMQGRGVLAKKLGEEFLEQLDGNYMQLLQEGKGVAQAR